MIFSKQDTHYMHMAIELAKQGRFTTTPNPNVGCVIVHNDAIVGQGFHQKAGHAHAEVNALNMAKDKAQGATAYVTLEPCSHFGRTPPCADALIKAGIARVVIAMTDPNSHVAGQGIARLQQAGIVVDVGLLADQAERLNLGFLKRMRTGLPYVQLKLAASLDGKTAMASGESKWITSDAARSDVQVYRAQASAILSTRQTVQTDDAKLTVRYSQLPLDIQAIYPKEQLREPVRVIIDGQDKLTGQESVFQGQAETWVVSKTSRLISAANSTVMVESSQQHHIDLHILLKQLGDKQINTLWVEAGASLAGALIEQNLVDELIVYYAPKLLGNDARGLCVLPNLTVLSKAPQFCFQSVTMIGEDLRCVLIPKK